MIARFVNTSSVTFNYNGTPQFKVFLPLKIGDNSVKVISAYDSRLVLMPTTNISNIEIDNQTYDNVDNAIDMLKDVVFAITGTSYNNDCCDENSNDIVDIRQDVDEIEDFQLIIIDDIIRIDEDLNTKAPTLSVPDSFDSSTDDEIKVLNTEKEVLFSLNIRNLKDQGTHLSVDTNGKLVLSNDYGEVLDKVTVQNQGGVLEEEILSNVEISEAAPAGTTFPEGMTMTEFVEAIAVNTFYPDLIGPSFSLDRSGSQLRIIGSSTTFTLTFNFNPGEIRGKLVNGVWDPNEEQNPRAGQATGYEIDGVETENNSLQVTKTVQQGINAFVAKVTYEDGPQPKDSVNNNYQSPLSGGTSPERSASFEGIYPLFATVDQISQENQLPNYSMLNANNIEIQLAGESGGNKQSFSIPDAWLNNRALDKVEYFNPVSGQFDTANKITDFDASSATKTIESQTIGYTKYTHNGGNRGSILIRLKF